MTGAAVALVDDIDFQVVKHARRAGCRSIPSTVIHAFMRIDFTVVFMTFVIIIITIIIIIIIAIVIAIIVIVIIILMIAGDFSTSTSTLLLPPTAHATEPQH